MSNAPSIQQETTGEPDVENPHPIYCVWEITLQCDLGCNHCGSRAGKSRPGELSTEKALDVVHQLSELGVRDVVLIGGEAYLREDWLEIVREITQCGMDARMTTGGRNLSQERVDRAAEAGLRSASVSIDGMERTHDELRNARGAWESAVASAERIADSPIDLTFNTQINRASMPELPDLANLGVDLGIEAWQIQLTVPAGRAADRPGLLLQPYELLDLFPMLVWLKKTRLDPNDIFLSPGNNIGYFGPWEHMLRAGGEFGTHWTGCPAGEWSLGLEADGTVKSCPSLPRGPYSGGNLADRDLSTIMEESDDVNRLQDRTVDDLWGYCADCYYAETCMAGCSWTAHTFFGDAGNNPYCIHRALETARSGEQERLRKVEDAPGHPFDHGIFEIVREPRDEETPGDFSSYLLDQVEKLSAVSDDEIDEMLEPA